MIPFRTWLSLRMGGVGFCYLISKILDVNPLNALAFFFIIMSLTDIIFYTKQS